MFSPSDLKIARPTKEIIYFTLAATWATRTTCRVPVGAVIVSPDGRVIASGYNGSPIGQAHCLDVGCTLDSDGHCIRAIHAEENAVIQCAIHGVSTKGASIYVTHQPCGKCEGVLAQAGIGQAYYLKSYRSTDRRIHVLDTYQVQASEELNELLSTLYSNNKK